MHGELKERSKQIRERLLDLNARGLTRRDAGEMCGISRTGAAKLILEALKNNDPRADMRPNLGARRGSIYGVPHDLVDAFKAAAAARQIDTNELRRRILTIVTRDNLFDALDLDEPALAPSRKEKRR